MRFNIFKFNLRAGKRSVKFPDGLDFYADEAPIPLAVKTSSSMPRPAHQPASVTSMTAAGRLPTPYSPAVADVFSSRMSRTSTSDDEPASTFTVSIVFVQAGRPALNISIFRLSTTIDLPPRSFESRTSRSMISLACAACLYNKPCRRIQSQVQKPIAVFAAKVKVKHTEPNFISIYTERSTFRP